MPGLVGELVPGCTAVVEEVVVGREDAVREPVLAHELPDVLDRVQLRALGRQCHEGDVWRDDQERCHPAWSGERWHCSTSTDVVGRLIEVVSGQKLEDYFREHIFAPLKWTTRPTTCQKRKGRALSRSSSAQATRWTARSFCNPRSLASPSRRRSAVVAWPPPRA